MIPVELPGFWAWGRNGDFRARKARVLPAVQHDGPLVIAEFATGRDRGSAPSVVYMDADAADRLAEALRAAAARARELAAEAGTPIAALRASEASRVLGD